MIFWLCFSAVLIFGLFKAPFFVWMFFIALLLFWIQAHWLWFLFFLLLVIFYGLSPIRRFCLTRPLMWGLRKGKFFPQISRTERSALEAGKTWIEKEFFSGRPHLKNLFSPSYAQLTEEEKNFLNNETDTLCSMIDDWSIYKTRKIPQEVDQYIRKNKFLGINIPKSYGGLGFSHLAHGRILEKICSRSYAVGIYVMVPNSLGPGELLLRYGTKEQRKYYLPRLADGREIPCFGLTEPRAGSDAGAIESEGFLFKDENGDLKIRLNWNKRWITLAGVSSLLGVAFQLKDPEKILGVEEDIGITCALIPSHTPGVKLGRRHDPMGIPFPNCPMEGHDVVVSASAGIIGGIEKAGQGWSMLMDCLGAGRGISLPSSALASSKRALCSTVYHSVVRRQFGLSIGKFEGVQELLSRMAGRTYLSQSMLSYTMSALNRHIPSALCSAMSKYQLTELSRKVISDGMDIMAGAGLSMGPRNLLALNYIGAPIAITVEGANILTRSFMIFGQGLLRAHPYAYKEIKALEEKDLVKFDLYFWSHVGLVIQNIIRLILLTATRGLVVFVPGWKGRGYRAWQKIAWADCLFSVLSEIAMLSFGGKLKIKEKLTGRFADVLMGLYMASSVLWHWDKTQRKREMFPFVQWGVEESFSLIQKSFENIFSNFHHKVLSKIFKIFLPIMRLNSFGQGPSDSLSQKICAKILKEPSILNLLTEGIYKPESSEEQMKKLEECYLMTLKIYPIERKIKKAQKNSVVQGGKLHQVVDTALKKNVITKEEQEQVQEWVKKSWEAIQVDSFTQEEYER